MHINDADGTSLKEGDVVVAIDVDDLEGEHPVRGEVLVVERPIDRQSNYIEFVSNKDSKPYAFYGHRVLKLK